MPKLQLLNFTPFSFALTVLLAASICAPAAADTYPLQHGIKVLKYDFEVTLSDSSDDVAVNDTVTLQFDADGVRGIDLDLCSLVSESKPADPLSPCLTPPVRSPRGVETKPAEPSSVGKGMTVTKVVSGNEALKFEHQNDRLHVVLPGASHTGEKFSFTVSYHGVPASGLFIGKNKYGDRVFFTDNWPNRARNWLATIDHISVKAPKDISVIAPRRYQVISNGLLAEETDLPGDLRKTAWHESLSIPPWQYSLGVAQMSVEYFGRVPNVEFSAWLFPQDRDANLNYVSTWTQPVFEFYRDHIGPYIYEKLAHVEAAGSRGATEPATTIFYYTGFGALSHEMAHQWFGDSVTESNWDDVWLSEGFATYFALLFTEHQQGHDAFLNGVRRARDVATNYDLKHPADTVVHEPQTKESEVFFNAPQIYQGGAMVLQTLRGVLGDQNFWAGIRLYYGRFHNGSATTDDLRHAMEDACYAAGNCPDYDQDLSWFFHEWLHQGGILQIKGTWHFDAQTKQLTIVLDQSQTTGLYRMPISIEVIPAADTTPAAALASQSSQRATNAGPRRQSPSDARSHLTQIWINQQHNTFSIPVDAAPTDVKLDPELWVPLMNSDFHQQ